MEKVIKAEECFIGIELGSTRIKAVMTDSQNAVLATGSYDWTNTLINGVWTYSMEEVKTGLQACYAVLKNNVKNKYNITLTSVKGMGISAMMHGIIALDKNGKILTPFRTWRNNITEEEATILSTLFNYPIPQRWTISHLYKDVREQSPWLKDVDYITTLSGYVQKVLTGKRVLGIGDASGLFPVDNTKKDYYQNMIDSFDNLLKENHIMWKLRDVFPTPLVCGEKAGRLTKEGALFLDPEGDLCDGILLCPPEGDVGTGMTATNSVRVNTGNVSAGTSVFAMVVLDKPLKKNSPKLDLVSSPDGHPVAMAHSNNCTSEYDSWINLFGEVIDSLGLSVEKSKLYDTVLSKAVEKGASCKGLVSYPYVSGEHVTEFSEGRPLVIKNPEYPFNLSSFMRSQLFGSVSALRVGLDILFNEEGVKIKRLVGHGGFFKTVQAGGRVMAAAANTPVSIKKTAGEGGAFGIAVLAAYMFQNDKSFPDFLDEDVFAGEETVLIEPHKEDVESFNAFYSNYMKCIDVERKAVEEFK